MDICLTLFHLVIAVLLLLYRFMFWFYTCLCLWLLGVARQSCSYNLHCGSQSLRADCSGLYIHLNYCFWLKTQIVCVHSYHTMNVCGESNSKVPYLKSIQTVYQMADATSQKALCLSYKEQLVNAVRGNTQFFFVWENTEPIITICGKNAEIWW
jgi:hypothetical protein